MMGGDKEQPRPISEDLRDAQLEDGDDAPDRTGVPRSTTTAEAFFPRRIGPYRIRRVIGSGGVGTVYEAGHEETSRIIALKVLKHGIASKSSVKRFEYEAQVLARLSHPNIAKVYEAGMHRDESGIVPFFAMEYIRGAKTITQYCKDEQLSTRDRMRLFVQACEAVHHGHLKGVIHRDLKPGNIVVDAEGCVKVIDFGVARGTDSDLAVTTSQQPMGQLIGTLQYMSPEQCEPNSHSIDTRSDVYALGLVFFELLTDRLPYDVRKIAAKEASRIVRERQPTRPSTVDRTLFGDAETIVFKALEKDRERRYQSAVEFAADIQAYLANEPIAARPPSRAYQFRVMVRHNKAAVGSLTALVLLLVSGVTFNTSQYLRAESAHQQAETVRAITERGRGAAEKSRDDARSVVRFLSGMLASVEPDTADNKVTVRTILDEASKTVGEKFLDRPLIEADLRRVIGASYFALGLYSVAEPHQTVAAAICRRELGPRHPQTLASNSNLANTLGAQGRIGVSGDMLRENYEITRRVLGEEDPETLRSMSNLALGLQRQGRNKQAEELQRKSLEIHRRVFGEGHRSTISSMGILATILFDVGRDAEAEALQRKTLEIRRRVLGEEHPETLGSMNDLASTLFARGRYAESETLVRKALTIRRRVLGPGHPNTLDSLNNLANVLWGRGRFADAEKLIREALEFRRRALGEEHPNTLAAVSNLAAAISSQGRYDEAESLLRATLGSQRRILGDKHPDTLISMGNLANALWGSGRFMEAEKLHREALEIRQRAFGEEHPDALIAMTNLAAAIADQGRITEAEELYRKALESQRRILGDEHPATLITMHNLAVGFKRGGRFAESEELFRTTLEIRGRVLGESHRHTLRSRKNLGETVALQGRLGEAEALLRETAVAARRAMGNDHPFLADPLVALAEVLLEKGELVEARSLIDEALAIRLAALPESHTHIAYTRTVLGECLSAQGQYPEAEALILDGYRRLTLTQGSSGYQTRRARARVIRLYEEWGKPEKAATYRTSYSNDGARLDESTAQQ